MTTLVTEILADSPALYWPLDDTVGVRPYDASGNGRPVNNGGGADPTWVSDPYAPTGNAAVFSGSNYWFINPLALDVYAWECFFYTASAIGPATGPYALMASAAVATPIVWLGGNVTGSLTNEVITMSLSSSAGGAGVCDITIPAGWHHLVVRWSGSGYHIWLDGVKQTVVSYGADTLRSSNGFLVASYSAGTNSFPGRVAHVAFYNADLSEARIKAHYAAWRAAVNSYRDLIVATPGCVGYWPLANGSTTDERRKLSLTWTAAATAVGPSGAPDTATLLNGSSSYAYSPLDSAYCAASRAVTTEIWARRDSGTGNVSVMDLAWTGNPCPLGIDTYGSGNNNQYRAFATGNSAANNRFEVPHGQTVALGKWHHLVAIYQPASPGPEGLSLYVNGALIGTDTSASGTTWDGGGSMNVWIGKYNGTFTQYFPGALAHAAVYARALTASEVYAHYVAGVSPSGLAVSY